MDQPLTAPARTLPDGSYAMTAEGLEALRAEVEQLRADKAREVERRLRESRAFGDPSTNDEQWAIREEEAVLEARIQRLEEIIRRARVVGDGAGNGHFAVLGSIVVLQDRVTGRTARYRLVGAHEPPTNGGIAAVSAASPIGLAIMGQPAGATVTVELPSGTTRELLLSSVEASPSARPRDP